MKKSFILNGISGKGSRRMQITKRLNLEKNGKEYCRLTHTVECTRRDSKETYEKEVPVAEFATVYRALQYIVDNDYLLEDDLDSIKPQLEEIVSAINEAKGLIKQEFRTEVRTTIVA